MLNHGREEAVDKRRLSRAAVFGLWVLCVVSNPSARAEPGPEVPKEKKLIGWACDRINTDELKRRVSELEQMPFDGVIITVYPDVYRRTEVPFTKDGRYGLWFGG